MQVLISGCLYQLHMCVRILKCIMTFTQLLMLSYITEQGAMYSQNSFVKHQSGEWILFCYTTVLAPKKHLQIRYSIFPVSIS